MTTGETAPIQLTTNGDTILATLAGDFDMQATFTVEPALERALQTPGLRRIELDLHRLQFIDSTGIGVIVRLHATHNGKASNCTFDEDHPRCTAYSRRPDSPTHSHSPRPTTSTPVDRGRSARARAHAVNDPRRHLRPARAIDSREDATASLQPVE